METKLKEIEREKRVNAAKRNLMLAESKVELHRKKVSEVAKKGDVTNDVHLAAEYRMECIYLQNAELDLSEAKEALIEADSDPDELDKVMKLLPI